MAEGALTVQKLLDMKRLVERSLDPAKIEVGSIDEFRALPNRERAVRTVESLKRMGRFTPDMEPRELDDHEVVAALLLGNGEITR